MTAPRHEIDPDAAGPLRFPLLIGDSVELSLPDFYSGGFRWDFMADEDALTVKALPKEPSDDPEAVGSCAPVVLAVTPRRAGLHSLSLELRRPWEPAPRRVVSVEIQGHARTIYD